MFVYVLDKNGKPLMPTKRMGMVRRWLKSERAVVIRREPFTIQLVDVEEGYTQPLTAGFDQGTAHIGVSVVSSTDEVFSGEFELRTDMSELITKRHTFRRSRRGHKTRYRAPRFLNRKHQDDLAPSVRAKVDESGKVFALLASILPITTWNVELGNFDVHKLVNPDVEGEGYQQGKQYGFYNTREYVLWRDHHTCQHCRGKSKDPVLEVHHLDPNKKVGSNRPANLLTLCATCHYENHNGKPLKLKAPPSFRAPTQFNIVKTYLQRDIEPLHPHITYGYLTKAKRIELKLPKSHRNDAFVIAQGSDQRRAEVAYLGVFARKQNRKLFKGARSHIRNTIPSAFGFKRGDRVCLPDGREGFIVGLRSRGYFNVARLDGTLLHASAKHSALRRLEGPTTLQIEHHLEKGEAHSSPA